MGGLQRGEGSRQPGGGAAPLSSAEPAPAPESTGRLLSDPRRKVTIPFGPASARMSFTVSLARRRATFWILWRPWKSARFARRRADCSDGSERRHHRHTRRREVCQSGNWFGKKKGVILRCVSC